MKILFLVKFYSPFDRGGSEWSTHDLALLLVKEGHEVTILTPNYGSMPEETIGGIHIRRLPFIKKLNDPKSPISPWWTNNILWYTYSTIYCTIFIFKNKFDIVHAHNNEFIPAAAISGILNNIPQVITFRDYQVLCNLGFCLWEKDKACNFFEYLTKDFNFFYQNYVNDKNFLKYTLIFAAVLRARLVQVLVFFFAKRVKSKIAVSQKVADIFKKNGIGNLHVIHNVVLVKKQPLVRPKQLIIYLGKLSRGKGVDLFVDCLPEVLKALPRVKVLLIGSGVLKKDLVNNLKKTNLSNKVTLLGQISHEEVLRTIREASIVVVPSIWPEPLPRSAIEALQSGVPLVVSNRGGTSEVVKKTYGQVSKPYADYFSDAIVKVYRRNVYYRKNIRKDLSAIKKHFAEEAVSNYLEIYKRVTK